MVAMITRWGWRQS